MAQLVSLQPQVPLNSQFIWTLQANLFMEGSAHRHISHKLIFPSGISSRGYKICGSVCLLVSAVMAQPFELGAQNFVMTHSMTSWSHVTFWQEYWRPGHDVVGLANTQAFSLFSLIITFWVGKVISSLFHNSNSAHFDRWTTFGC